MQERVILHEFYGGSIKFGLIDLIEIKIILLQIEAKKFRERRFINQKYFENSYYRSSQPEVFCRKGVLKISQN